jgi:hypothetical protein
MKRNKSSEKKPGASNVLGNEAFFQLRPSIVLSGELRDPGKTNKPYTYKKGVESEKPCSGPWQR